MKDIQLIIESKSINDEEKEIKIKGIINELKKKEKDELRRIFNIQANKLILKYINDSTTIIQKLLFDIIELVAEHEIQYENNQFFDVFQQSGLLIRIEQMIQEKIEQKEKENNQFSEITQQLMRIYLNIMQRQQIEDEMKEKIIKIMGKSELNIFGSNLISEQEKESKALVAIESMKNKDINELLKTFDIKQFIIIENRIKNCNTSYKKILLGFIELVAEKGIQYYNNTFFCDFKSSGLLDLIKNQIKDTNEKEKKVLKYLDETEQLVKIYIQIMKGRKSDNEMINICSQIIDRNTSNLFNAINYIKEDNNKVTKNEQRNEDAEKEIKQSTQLIKMSVLIGEEHPFSGTGIPDHINKLIKERFVPLIHINCPSYIKCQQCISVVSSASIQQLHIAIFQALAEVPYYNEEFFNMLINDHNIIPHLTSTIIQFVSQSQLNMKIIQQQKQQSKSFNQSIISSSLVLIHNLIKNKDSCKQLVDTQNFLNSLIKLTEFKFNNNANKEEDRYSNQIRNKSQQCLDSIHRQGDVQVLVELVTNGYPRVLVIVINTASGNEYQQNWGIYRGLRNIFSFIGDIIYRREQTNQFDLQPSFPSKPVLFKSCQEQFEDEGANEEIEAYLANRRSNFYANCVKERTSNFYIDNSNPKPWWYNL